ncbi:hypothetical protein AMJ57_03630 [Parcubacteria bacterium SG8_24]|nr:MAG: hypothetical protein AMJ57_03630 [Parcubacteria bacterium SG8_24]
MNLTTTIDDKDMTDMEPAMAPLHPKVPALLEHLELQAVDAVKWNLLLCVEKGSGENSPTHVLKMGDTPRKAESIAYEVRVMREILPQLDQRLFDRLSLPEYIDDGNFEGLHWVLSRYIRGRALVYEWSELSTKQDILGGKGIDEKVAALAVDVLRDLRSIDIGTLPDFVRRFSFEKWAKSFQERSRELVEGGLMSQPTIDAAMELFSQTKVKRYEGSMFTNGDFYPRNFIFLPDDRIAVVDWVGGVDPWEFVAMHAWLLMWGNPRWQIRYIREIREHFPIDVEEMQVGLLVKSFEQIYKWREEPEEYIGFARSQMLSYFRNHLEIERVREILA